MYGKQTTAYLSLIVARLGRGVGRFMLTVLLLNFLSTAALSAAAADRTDDLLSSEQSFVICTPQGLKRITLDENGNPTEDGEGNLEHCVYCLPFHKGVISAAFTVTDFPVVAPVSYKPLFAQYVSILPDAPLNTASRPRDPPLS
ncbi:MAG: DUF2946 family protein [Emcibacter sp.]|nr:DUF2946 family protein [Emcibacter sp.]